MNYPSEFVRETVASLPHLPGVYQFVDKDDTIIYVGKAKDLKKRVSSYFVEGRQEFNRKLQVLVSKIVGLRFTVVASEAEAFLLENNFIKKHRPRYNILLKDDKTYPSICVKKELFPRIFATRNIVKDGSKYYGPYASSKVVHLVLDVVRKLYPLRSCKLNLSIESILSGRFKPCLEMDLGNCLAPCVGKQSVEDYDRSVAMISSVLRGNLAEVKAAVRNEMMTASELLQFELANELKYKLLLLDNFQSRSTVAGASVGNVDVFCFVREGTLAYSNFMRVAGGTLVYAHTMELNVPLDNPPEELLSFAIAEVKEMVGALNKELIVPFLPDVSFEEVSFTIPQRGDKLQLLKLSEQNCRAYIAQRIEQLDKLNPEIAIEQKLTTLKQELRLACLPYHIECFDNSNTQGTNPVASCVVFKNGKPSKKDYRHFLIKTVDSPDDFASMAEIIHRRYHRLIEEQQPLPQLIVVDGGKGQLSSAVASLEELGLMDKIGVVGLAKRLEEVFLPNDPTPLYLNKNSFSLRLLMQLRDEAHRFGITFHRKRRSAAMLANELEQVSGVGEKTIDKLLAKYKTMSKIKTADVDELTELVGTRAVSALRDAGFLAPPKA
jgi:excinuclease ABC subunit C